MYDLAQGDVREVSGGHGVLRLRDLLRGTPACDPDGLCGCGLSVQARRERDEGKREGDRKVYARCRVHGGQFSIAQQLYRHPRGPTN